MSLLPEDAAKAPKHVAAFVKLFCAISYMEQEKGRITGLVTFCVETAFYNRLLKESKRRIEVTGRRGRRCRKLLDDLKERIGYSHLKEEAIDSTTWSGRFGRGFGPVVRQTAK
jgi:hypothetical protein